MFSEFPAGAAGVGLLLLRLAATMLLAFAIARPAAVDITDVALGILAIALIIGLFTRIAGAVCTAVVVIVATITGGEFGAVIGMQALSAAAIALLGPGAYSIDARLFGRRVVDVR